MEPHNLDLAMPLTRDQWEQVGQRASSQPEIGDMRWAPAEFEVIHLAIREGDAPKRWEDEVPPLDGIPPEDREVARFVYNDGKPFAELEPPPQPRPPAVDPEVEHEMQVYLEKWVREKWHALMRDSGLYYDRPRIIIDPDQADEERGRS